MGYFRHSPQSILLAPPRPRIAAPGPPRPLAGYDTPTFRAGWRHCLESSQVTGALFALGETNATVTPLGILTDVYWQMPFGRSCMSVTVLVVVGLNAPSLPLAATADLRYGPIAGFSYRQKRENKKLRGYLVQTFRKVVLSMLPYRSSRCGSASAIHRDLFTR